MSEPRTPYRSRPQAKDISESLGKLPPQANELEEAVLGAILLSNNEFLKIVDLIRPNHFYTDQHKEIYSAIFSLWIQGKPIDMRTVVHQLRESGKLEIVGGAYYIAELTSKVSSAANIEYHARIIIEMSIKRDIIQIASQIHHDAYEDTTDVFELLDNVNKSIQGIRVVSPKRSIEQYIKTHSFNADNPPQEEDTLLYLQGIPIGSRENIITITGKSKSRKTIAASALATSFFTDSAFLGFSADLPEDATIIHIDTEQGYKHYYHSVKRIFDQASTTPQERFISVHTRDATIPQRIELLQHLCETYNPSVIIVDGVTDLVYDINSQEESTKIGELFLKLSSQYKCLIVAVIHTTKTTGYMTGAIGTILEKKSETVIKVELDEEDKMTSHISCQFSRNKPFQSFSITADADNNYSVMDESNIKEPGKVNLNEYALPHLLEFARHILGLGASCDEKTFKKRLSHSSKEILKADLSVKYTSRVIEFLKSKMILAQNPDGMFMLGPYTVPSEASNQTSLLNPDKDDDQPF